MCLKKNYDTFQTYVCSKKAIHVGSSTIAQNAHHSLDGIDFIVTGNHSRLALNRSAD